MATKKLVEPGLYAGRKSGSGKDGLPKCDEHEENQFVEDKHAPGYDNIVPDARRSNDAHGVNPNFDSDAPRKVPKSTGGGGNTEKSPFSAAGKNLK